MFNWLRCLLNDPAEIDTLIALKGVKGFRPGMEVADTHIISREGQRRWEQVLRAQRRTYGPARVRGHLGLIKPSK